MSEWERANKNEIDERSSEEHVIYLERRSIQSFVMVQQATEDLALFGTLRKCYRTSGVGYGTFTSHWD